MKSSPSKDFIDQLNAGIPILYILSSDEEGALLDIRRSIMSLNSEFGSQSTSRTFGLYEWSCSSGTLHGIPSTVLLKKKDQYKNYINGSMENKDFVFPPPKKVSGPSDPMMATKRLDPLFALTQFEKRLQSEIEGGYRCEVVVLKDFHPYLKNEKVIRKLKEIALMNDESDVEVRRCFVILSSVRVIPVEFQNMVNVIDWGLPDKKEIVDYIKSLGNIEIVDKKKEWTRSKSFDHKESYTSEEISEIHKSLSGLSIPEIKNIISVSQIKHGEIVPEFLMEQKKQAIIRNGMLEYYDVKENMDDIGGMDCLKEWVRKRKKAFTDKAREFHIEPPKGVMLVGIQGCGKSQMAKAIASVLGMPLLRFDVGKVFSKTVGSSEENIRSVISLIEAVAPCVLMIDEIEKGLAGIQSSNQSDGGTTARVIGTLLQWLSDKTSDVFVVATANNIQQLPPELQRKGRFDELFFVPLPEAPEREEIYNIHLRKRKRDPEKFSVAKFAALSDKFSGAECEEAVRSALILAFNEDEELQDKHVISAIKDLIPLWQTCKEDLKYLYEWVDWDEEKEDGVRARFASTARKEVSKEQGSNVIEFNTKKSKNIKAIKE